MRTTLLHQPYTLQQPPDVSTSGVPCRSTTVMDSVWSMPLSNGFYYMLKCMLPVAIYIVPAWPCDLELSAGIIGGDHIRSPSPEQNNTQTPVKTLPSHNFVGSW